MSRPIAIQRPRPHHTYHQKLSTSCSPVFEFYERPVTNDARSNNRSVEGSGAQYSQSESEDEDDEEHEDEEMTMDDCPPKDVKGKGKSTVAAGGVVAGSRANASSRPGEVNSAGSRSNRSIHRHKVQQQGPNSQVDLNSKQPIIVLRTGEGWNWSVSTSQVTR